MDGEISVTIGWEVIDAGELGCCRQARILAMLVDHQIVSMRELSEEDFKRLCS